MRKIVLILTIAISCNLMAKKSYRNQGSDNFVVGITAGMNGSQVDGDGYGGYNKLGLSVGTFVYKKLSQSIDMQLDITLKQKGSQKNADTKNGDNTEYYIHLNYIEFPLVVRYHFLKFSVEGGLYAATLISSREGSENGDYTDANAFEKIEAGTIFGLNYHITKKFWVNTRFEYSLNAIRTPYNGDITVYAPTKNYLSQATGEFNNVWSLALYYTFK